MFIVTNLLSMYLECKKSTRNTVKLVQFIMKKSESSSVSRPLLSVAAVEFRSKNVLIANLLVPKLVSILM